MPSERVVRPCEGSRYCSFAGPLYRQRLALVEPAPQAIVGGCWFESFEYLDEPSRFVCNRCAHRTLAYDARAGPLERVWLLLCPFCGEPLGEPGAATLLFDGEGNAMAELELPGREAIADALRHKGAGP